MCMHGIAHDEEGVSSRERDGSKGRRSAMQPGPPPLVYTHDVGSELVTPTARSAIVPLAERSRLAGSAQLQGAAGGGRVR